MDSRSDLVRRITIGAAAVLVSSLGFYFGTGLPPIWWIAWIAPLPVLLASSQLSVRAAFPVALLARLFGELNMWHYLRDLLNIPLVVSLFILLLPGLVFALAVLLFRRFLLRSEVWRAAIAFPAVWVAYEYLLSLSSPHGTFGSLAYSQLDCLSVLQMASIAGLGGSVSVSSCYLQGCGGARRSSRPAPSNRACSRSVRISRNSFRIWLLAASCTGRDHRVSEGRADCV